MGLFFQEVPTVNPSVKNQRFLPAPFSKGAFGVQRRSPPCQRGVVWQSQTGGIPQAGRFPHRLLLLESACCESLSHGCAVPAPFSKGAFLRPVSFYGAIPGFFHLPIHSVGTRRPKNHNPKRGQRLNPTTRAKAKGQSPDGSTRGILKGGAIRAGASCSPLEPASLHTFLPEQESMALLASTCRRLIGE